MTPGVYIEEKDAFPGSVVAVETAVPAFIGYTEKAIRNGKSLINTPVRITSLAEYDELFGGAFKAKFIIEDPEENETRPITSINESDKVVDYDKKNKAYMFPSIKLFYANGGSACYILSVGLYKQDPITKKFTVEIDKEELLGETKEEGGLKTLLKVQEPTMIVVPDAVNLGDDCYTVYQAVLKHCYKMQSRVAILDIHDGYQNRIRSEDSKVDIITKFREDIGSENLNYAAAYYPWLNTNIVQKKEISFENLKGGLTDLIKLLPEPNAVKMMREFPEEADLNELLINEKPQDVEAAKKADLKPDLIKKIDDPGDENFEAIEAKPVLPTDADEETQGNFPELLKTWENKKKEHGKKVQAYKLYLKFIKTQYTDTVSDEAGVLAANNTARVQFENNFEQNLKDGKQPNYQALLDRFRTNKNRNLHLGLVATSPTYSLIIEEICSVMNLLPPSSAMAGIYTMVDNSRGVWKAPANVSVSGVVKPSINITHDDQENLNVDAVSGKSINAIRTFPGVGTMVWGGRTLDGNSLDWKYINVRRTMIMLEQSIKLALRSYVFEPNDANTWVTVKSMIVNFLSEKWKQGALAGASPEDAFEVQIGLGSTMTSLDILEGKMFVSVKLAIVRPAEFIVVTFEQQMQKS